MDSDPAVTADAAVVTLAVATRSGSCSYFAAAETARTYATCYRCYLSSAAAAEAIRAGIVLATPVAINSFPGGDARSLSPDTSSRKCFREENFLS